MFRRWKPHAAHVYTSWLLALASGVGVTVVQRRTSRFHISSTPAKIWSDPGQTCHGSHPHQTMHGHTASQTPVKNPVKHQSTLACSAGVRFTRWVLYGAAGVAPVHIKLPQVREVAQLPRHAHPCCQLRVNNPGPNLTPLSNSCQIPDYTAAKPRSNAGHLHAYRRASPGWYGVAEVAAIHLRHSCSGMGPSMLRPTPAKPWSTPC